MRVSGPDLQDVQHNLFSSSAQIIVPTFRQSFNTDFVLFLLFLLS